MSDGTYAGMFVGTVLLVIAMFVGWVMNIISLCSIENFEFCGQTIAQIAGIFIAPLGGVLGYIF